MRQELYFKNNWISYVYNFVESNQLQVWINLSFYYLKLAFKIYLLPVCTIDIVLCYCYSMRQNFMHDDLHWHKQKGQGKLHEAASRPPARSCALMDGVCVFISEPTVLSGPVCCSAWALPGHSDLHRLGAPRPGGLRHPAVLLLLLLALDLRGRHLLLDVPARRLPRQHFCKYTHSQCHQIVDCFSIHAFIQSNKMKNILNWHFAEFQSHYLAKEETK